MNLRAIANSITSTINPNTGVVIKKYMGRTINADGTVSLTYTSINATAQMQPAPSYRLRQVLGYTMGGIFKDFYFNEDLKGITAPNGEDFIVVGNDVYKVIEQSEGWYSTSGWSRVSAQKTTARTFTEYVENTNTGAQNGTNN